LHAPSAGNPQGAGGRHCGPALLGCGSGGAHPLANPPGRGRDDYISMDVVGNPFCAAEGAIEAKYAVEEVEPQLTKGNSYLSV
jgi:hypothetical protein